MSDALKTLLSMEPPPLKELVLDPQEAVAHVVSREVRAERGVPPWKRAGLDGYAVRARDTPGKLRLLRLPVTRDSRVEPPSLPEGTAAYTPTGAYLPQGADTLVPLELAEERGEWVSLPSSEPGRNVDGEGSLVREGGVLIKRGSLVTPARAAGLVDAGVNAVWVWERIRVAIVPVGLEKGQRDTTGPLVEWLFRRLPWVSPVLEKPLIGGGEAVANGLLRLLDEGGNHAVVMLGRVGPGVDDFFDEVTRSLGASTVLRGVALKGARPFTALVVEGRPLLWLPGMPTSAVVSFLSLVLPLMEKWGRVDPSWRGLAFRRVSVDGYGELGGRRTAFAALAGPCEARVLERRYQRSSSIVSLSLADGVVFLGPEDEGWGEGAWFLPLGSW